MELILPGSLEYELTINSTLPPGWQEFAGQHQEGFAFVTRFGGSGLLEPMSETELAEYIMDGELAAREAERNGDFYG